MCVTPKFLSPIQRRWSRCEVQTSRRNHDHHGPMRCMVNHERDPGCRRRPASQKVVERTQPDAPPGSILPGLHKEDVSDIDFVIFGLENHRKAMKAFRENKGKNVHIDEVDKDITVNGIVDEFWEKVYNKRMKDSSLTMDEFKWYENRKGNRGTINGTLFDILCTKNYDEISGKWGDTVYEPLGIAQIECDIVSALGAFDNPSLYTIENLKILDGVEAPISEVVSFTHTYAGEVIDGEHVLAKGKVEKVISEGKKDSYRLVVGTTRESMDEYVKLKESPA